VRIAGLPSVTELFETGADRVERLYFEGTLKAEVQAWCASLARRRKIYRQIGDDEMRRVAGTAMHGGIVALARPRLIRDFDPALAGGWAEAGHALLILDGVGNPQNIGAIARTAAFFGVRRMLLSGHPQQAGLSDAAYRVAKGGVERIEFYRAEVLPEALRRLADHYLVVGTVAAKGVAPGAIDRKGKPVALVLGNEEEGLSRETQGACAKLVTLPGRGHVQSLNVSAAAAILIHTLLTAS
jgi:TrmH RNA methyltransferase